MTTINEKKLGSVFYLDTTKKALQKLDENAINAIPVRSVKNLTKKIVDLIGRYETVSMKCDDTTSIENEILIEEDITFKIIEVHRWRRGFCFIGLQISLKNRGSARLTAYTTDTVHHSATCFGTTPEVDEAMNALKETYKNMDLIMSALTELKTKNATKLTVDQLLTNMFVF